MDQRDVYVIFHFICSTASACECATVRESVCVCVHGCMSIYPAAAIGTTKVKLPLPLPMLLPLPLLLLLHDAYGAFTQRFNTLFI